MIYRIVDKLKMAATFGWALGLAGLKRVLAGGRAAAS
jgi:hypothetical protein